ncbi:MULTISPECIES: amidohydrolase family protein [unclassified Chelatococcus]|uniref:dihydroorotase n=1 Tax=unclassified Chelatococcus TaxID=2638111 RepID=UPI001BCF3708|nr:MULTISPECIES: amidohydrolase family protein [unclassified Chelatococcus]CAH1659505.1 Dihydropyrimidinase [Hyphomicrobiales bacterium]MBS7740953.1 amidohydrolase family protein [Chelatococcus sp. HY11]MBX3546756.1 amidohydrolase family protein [Chelatococcus sp.]MCO5077773.1 amidohydrolase family protein [Chelatococcus sp.]CAH1683790.1 Dihydropyrimidinase [Hyphomicrobiales bacterium]
MSYDLILANGEIVFPDRGIRTGSILVRNGKIAGIVSRSDGLKANEIIDCKDKWVLPGLIDPHTHIGFGSNETDFLTESRSAALGGVTSLLTFHRSNDLSASTGPWRKRGEEQSLIDFSFHFGVTSKLHIETLAETTRRFGVTSIKVYLMYKGASGAAKGFTEIDDGLLFAAMLQTRNITGGVVGVHCENVEVIPVFRDPLKAAGRNDLPAWDEQSPGFLEAENVFRVAYFGEKAECPVNIVHMSSAESLEIVRNLRRPGRAPIHVETCSHYLSLTRNSPIGLLGKVNPPLRSQSDVDALWEGIRDGTISTVGSDHVGRKRETKGPDIWKASAGFPGLGTMLRVLVHEGVHKRGIPIERIAAVTSANVARLYSIPNKGELGIGMDADMVIVDPDREVHVDPTTQESYSDYSPYEGMTFKGSPVRTILRGRTLASDGALDEQACQAPAGRYLNRIPGVSR